MQEEHNEFSTPEENNNIDKEIQINQNTDEQENNELAKYFAQVLDNICNTVRNKMVAPYTVLKNMDSPESTNSTQELIDISINDINWLCHNYLPKIASNIQSKSQQSD